MIAHVDGDAFFASVLERQQPHLRGKPLLVLGMGGGSCVIAANYLAKRQGVKTGMPLREAKKLLSDFQAVPADFMQTGVASGHIEQILRDACADIECSSIDEWFLDLHTIPGGIPENLSEWAVDLQKKVLSETGLPVSVGIAPTKTLAKMGSDYRKPRGITIIEHQKRDVAFLIDIETFLRSLDIRAIPGIGRHRSVHARSLSWNTAFEFATADTGTAVHLFGKPGAELQHELLGVPVYDVVTEDAPPKSVSRCRTFQTTRRKDVVKAYLLEHLSYTILKMRRHNLSCKYVVVWLRNPSYDHQSSEAKTSELIATEERILPYVQRCFEKVYEPNTAYNQVGVLLGSLHPVGPLQYSLFEQHEKLDQSEALQSSMDHLRDQYGRDVIRRGASVLLHRKTKELPFTR